MSTLSRSIVLAVVAAVLAGAQPAAGQRAQPGPLRLVFESNRTGTWQVYSVPASGGALAQLTFAAAGARNPRPSPDGRTLLVERSGGIWLLRADGTQPRPLVAAGHSAAWSRDGRKFAYVGPASRPGIHVYELRARSARRVTSHPRDAQPSWSPDGRSLLFVRDGSVIVRQGGRARTVAAGATAAAWSPEGRWISFVQRVDEVLPHAVVTTWAVSLARPDGRGTRHLFRTGGWVGNSWARTSWSPDSRSIAVADNSGVTVVDVRTGSTRLLVHDTTREAVWSPLGTELAVAKVDWPRIDVVRVPLAGGSRRLLKGGSVDDQRSLGWTRPPRGTRFRAPQAASPLQFASPRELRSREPIRELSADGGRVAYDACGVSTWQPGGAIGGPGDPEECSSIARSRRGWVGKVTLGGDRIAYAVAGGGNSRWARLHLARVEAPWPGAEVASAGGSWLDTCCSPLLPRLGYVLGDGPLVVFSTWTLTACGSEPWNRCFETQTVWRVGASGVPEEVAAGGGTLEPLSVDRGRVVLRRGEGDVAVVDEAGGILLELPFAPGAAVAAELSGRDLVVVVPGELRHYDAGRGRLLGTWPLPLVPSGGFCGLWTACDSLDPLRGGPGELVLEDLVRGIVAYRLHGELRLLRLRDGAEASIGPATSAQLEDEGLFYSYLGDETWPGRIRFVPFDELPLRP